MMMIAIHDKNSKLIRKLFRINIKDELCHNLAKNKIECSYFRFPYIRYPLKPFVE